MAIEPFKRPTFSRSGISDPSGRNLPSYGHTMESEVTEGFRWDVALVWFMRLLAIAWLVKGLAYWAVLLGCMPHVAPFETQTLQWQSAVVYFAAIDLVAAIGLWFTSAWGGVMWLLAALSYFLVAIFVSHAVVSGILVLGGLALLIVAYFLLSWLASRIAV